uniref:Guanylate kinase n=1 Tax=Candidatus Kentrum sp. MB TaxID=2138164 RepID=A0A450XZY8_9GAMM|nr:MAG: Guanylate kinase [Candidatus Kentron sp. MB]VFK34857.1 MAG: Guanylate kinase [Candidatus Kentron sp. MB]VFK77006.1 MAG: Guanylate kinase [Candidatus Kentron sp. MB]
MIASTCAFPRHLLALTGPSGVGKTTISQRLIDTIADYVQKPLIITTRLPSRYDDGEYHYVTTEKFLELKKSGELAADTMLPPQNEQRRYGYRIKDLEVIWQRKRIPIVITEMHLLQGFIVRYGRNSIFSCGLLPPGESKEAMLSVLLDRLHLRNRDSRQSIRGRIGNAEHDLLFFNNRADLFDHILVNDDIDSIVSILAKYVIRAVEGS